MATLSEESRARVHTALACNYAALNYAYCNLNEETSRTIAEMVEVTSIPYREENLNFVGDTLDRHSYSCFGNLCEVVTLMTMLKHEEVSPRDVHILRSIEDQVTTKADLRIDNATYQVKTASYGTGGQLFIAEHELEGTADYMTYVDMHDGNVFRFERQHFRRRMKEEMDIGGPYDRWWGKAGWFVSPYDVNCIEPIAIPPGVTGVYQQGDNHILITRTL